MRAGLRERGPAGASSVVTFLHPRRGGPPPGRPPKTGGFLISESEQEPAVGPYTCSVSEEEIQLWRTDQSPQKAVLPRRRSSPWDEAPCLSRPGAASQARERRPFFIDTANM